MGGYLYRLALAGKPNDAAVMDAARELWEWFYVEARDRATTPFGEMVRAYAETYTPSVSTTFDDWPSLHLRDGALEIGLGDAGGTARLTMLATVHMLTLLVDRDPEVLRLVLERNGLEQAKKQTVDRFIREQRFFYFDDSIAAVVEGAVERDSDGTDDGAAFEIDKLLAEKKMRVQAFMKNKKCECPVCE